MITISTRDYSIEQLKHLSAALSAVLSNTLESKECGEEMTCTTHCKEYAFCSDVYNTLAYINKKIKEREALELH